MPNHYHRLGHSCRCVPWTLSGAEPPLQKHMALISHKDPSCHRFIEKDFILATSILEGLAQLSTTTTFMTKNYWHSPCIHGMERLLGGD